MEETDESDRPIKRAGGIGTRMTGQRIRRITRRIIIGIAVSVCFGAALVGGVGAQAAEGGAVFAARLASPIDSLAADAEPLFFKT